MVSMNGSSAGGVGVSGRPQHHLTGEMIRKIRMVNSGGKPNGDGGPGPPMTTMANAATAHLQQRLIAAQQAQLAQHFQQQQQMQAAYERALKVGAKDLLLHVQAFFLDTFAAMAATAVAGKFSFAAKTLSF